MLFVGLHVKRMKEQSDLAVHIIQQNIVISCVSVPIYMRLKAKFIQIIYFLQCFGRHPLSPHDKYVLFGPFN